MGIGQRDLSSNHPSPRTHWRSSIVWSTIPWRVATGQSCGGLAKDCPPNRWRPSPATRPTGCTPSPSITMKTAPQVSAIGIIATPIALDSSQARRIRPWQACSTSRHPRGGVGRGRRSPPGWPALGPPCTRIGAGTSSDDLACAPNATATARQGSPGRPIGRSKKLPSLVQRKRDTHPRDVIELWTVDQHRFGLTPILRRVWCRRGSAPPPWSSIGIHGLLCMPLSIPRRAGHVGCCCPPLP